ncbi:hypothetical protein GEMRC1_007384 [Eukaryota sp. GEM-RC1]
MDVRQRKPQDQPPSAPSQTSAPQLLRDNKSKWTNWFIRTKSAIVLVLIVGSSVAAGHFGLIALNSLIQVLLFHELTRLSGHATDDTRDEQNILPFSQLYKWSWFVLTWYAITGLVIFTRFSFDQHVGTIFSLLVQYHTFVCFLAACFLFVYFIATLEPPYWPKMKSLFWIFITLLIIFTTTGPILNPLLEGVFWFIFPTIIVAINDTAAYISGFFFGKHKLCNISPKKTIEGFVGALFVTVIVSYFLAGLLSNYHFMVCPKDVLSLNPRVTCSVDPLFLEKSYFVPLLNKEFVTKPIQLHALFFGLFASSIAPFGGLFASATKRALKIKDFSNLIPGHGGVADRVDCQIFMLLFSTIWFNTFVRPFTVSHLMYYSQYLPFDQQLALFNVLKKKLVSAGIPVN